MIWDSSHWKDDLLRISKKIEKRKKQKRWSERTFVNFEKEVFLSFYIIRKLIEANKISSDWSKSIISGESHPSLGKEVTMLNFHRIDELYDLSVSNKEQLDLRFICNQVIHSYIFIPQFDEKNLLSGIFFSSDRDRNEKVHFLDIGAIINILNQVGSDYPNKAVGKYSKKKKDFIVTQKTNK